MMIRTRRRRRPATQGPSCEPCSHAQSAAVRKGHRRRRRRRAPQASTRNARRARRRRSACWPRRACGRLWPGSDAVAPDVIAGPGQPRAPLPGVYTQRACDVGIGDAVARWRVAGRAAAVGWVSGRIALYDVGRGRGHAGERAPRARRLPDWRGDVLASGSLDRGVARPRRGSASLSVRSRRWRSADATPPTRPSTRRSLRCRSPLRRWLGGRLTGSGVAAGAVAGRRLARDGRQPVHHFLHNGRTMFSTPPCAPARWRGVRLAARFGQHGRVLAEVHPTH